MTIRQTIWSAVALVALFIGGQNLFLALEVKKLSSEVVELAQRREPMLLAAKDLEIAIIQVQQWLSDISATRGLDGLDDGLSKAEQNAQDVYRQVEQLSRLDEGKAAQYQALLPVFDNYYGVGKEMAALYVNEGPEAGNAVMPRFDAASDELQKRVDEIVGGIEQRTQRVGSLAKAEVDSLIARLWAAFGVLLLVVGGVAALLQLKVLRPIRHINELAKDIAQGERDLTKRLMIKGRTELTEVALWFNSFIDKIHQLVSQVKNSVGELDREAVSLKQVTELTNKNVAQQNQRTNQAAVAVSQMAATVTEVAQNAAIAADAAVSADEETQKGSSAVALTEQAIHDLAREIESAATVICSLESDSEKIGGVLDVIRGIAEQTNLLALNAAIEAARAGEQGRGFAVVADEVRNLASRTQESTEEIHSMIESLQRASEKAVAVMQDSQKRAAESVEKANAAGESLKTIAQTIARISDMNTQIATAAEEQSATAVEIDNNIAGIKNVGSLTSEDAHKTETSGRRLGEVAGELKHLVAQYRV